MKRGVAFAVALACLAASPALAANNVSFVSVTGNDARNCATPETACRTFQRAHDATSPHGEIIALTPGDYRPVTITKSISVTGVAGAGVFGGTGPQIVIAAGAGSAVHLTGLTLEGASSARNGIDAQSAATVTIRKCAVANTTSDGIVMVGLDRTLIEDTSISNGNNNVVIFGGRNLVHRVDATNARASAIVSGDTSTIAEISASGSRDGTLQAGRVFLIRSAVTGNSRFGVIGDLTSAGDNLIRGNGTDVNGTITTLGLQ
jgi:hypothetical protein